jgi:DNA-binding MarR family transcriptional regulator
VYAWFLQLQREARSQPGTPAMDAMEERVFEALAACWGQGRPVTVLQAMSMTAEASPTTVHRRLKSLRKKDLIRLHEDESDNRIKYVHATDTGMAYLEQMGRCLQGATSAQ